MTTKPSNTTQLTDADDPNKEEGHLELTQSEISDAIEVAEALDLSSIKTNWYFGEWQKLATLDLTAVSQSPDRAVLALLIASAHIQLNNEADARRLTRQALQWGCSPRSAAKVLSAGVHNTLARVAALRGREEKTIHHFRSSVEVVDRKNVDLIAHARSVREMTKLGLVDQASVLIDRQIEQSAQARGFTTKRAQLSAIQGGQQVIAEALRARDRLSWEANEDGVKTVSAPDAYATGERLVILVSGMRHSGSTALFNVLRLGLESQGIPFESGYTEKFDVDSVHQKSKGIFLLKTHEYRDDVAELADFIFTTKRDLRDTVASAVRRQFPLCDRLSPVEYGKYNRQLWEIWSVKGNYEFQYERYIQGPIEVLSDVLNRVGLEGCDANSIYREINNLPTDKYDVTLLSPTHITDPERKLTYRDTLTPEQVALINRNNSRWLGVHGYE